VVADEVGDSDEAPLPSSQRSVEEERRHSAFRQKLLGSNDPIKRWDDAYRRQEEAEAGGAPQEAGDEAGSPIPQDEDDTEGPEDRGIGASGALGRFASTGHATQKSSTNGHAAASGRKASSSSAAVKYTPLEQQVVDLKKKHPDVLLFFEVGYKFIAYEEDAVAASKELNIACFPKNHLRQASIPVHRLHIHARRLVNSGFKVGVVRQTETRALKAASTNAYTPFTRQLTELYTASTWVEDLDAEGSRGDNPVAQNSLVALVERLEGGNYGGDERVSIGLICVQAATGVVIFDQFADSSMRSELETRLAHLQPAELLLPPVGKLSKPTEKLLRHLTGHTSTSTLAGLTTANRVRTERTRDVMSYNDAFSQLSTFYEDIAAEEAKDEYPLLDAEELERELNGSTATSPSADTSRVKDDSEVGRALAFIMKMPHLAVISLATCLQHLQSFGLSSVFKVASSFISFQARSEMLLSTGTLYNLELFSTTEGTHKGSLFWLLDKCKTTFGKRLLRKWIGRPLTNLQRLKERTDAVSELVDGRHSVLKKVPELLIQQPDLEKGLARILYGRATPNELATVLLALNRISQQFEVTDAAEVGTGSTLLNESIAALPRIKDTVVRALSEIRLVAARKGEKENMFIEEKYPQLQEGKDRIAMVDSELSEHLLELRKLLKRPTLEYATVSGIECLVEVRVADAKKVPADWLRMSATKSMVRFHTPTIMQLLKGKNRHKELLAAEAAKAYQSFLDDLCEESTALRNAIAALGTLDALLSLAAVATLPGYVKPTYVEGEGLLSIRGLRHPMSEALRDDYVPNDIELGKDSKGVILTGANMGGKVRRL
jgi:DNA mismatch repair protein MSH3